MKHITPQLRALSSLIALITCLSTQYAAAQSQGLSGEYYPERNFNTTPTLRIDPVVDFQWGNGGPFDEESEFPVDRFQVRWRGWIVAPQSAYYTLSTRSDDGVRLFVDGVTLINQWRGQPPTMYTARRVWLDAGVTVPITIEYFEQGGGAVMELYWRRGDEPQEIIPESALRPWAEGQTTGQRVSAALSRPYLWEGTSTSVATVLVARPHSDLSQELSVELTWEGDGLERVTGRRNSVTIAPRQSLTTFDIRLIDDLEAQAVQELQVRVVGSDASPAVLTLRDDDERDAPQPSLLSGIVSAPGSEELRVSATPLFEGEAGTAIEEFVVGDRYSLSLPEGRYRVEADALRAGERQQLILSAEALEGLDESAELSYNELNEVVSVTLALPPSQLNLDFHLALSENMGGMEAGAEPGGAAGAGAEGAGAEGAGAEAGGEPSVTSGVQAGAEAGAEPGAEPEGGLSEGGAPAGGAAASGAEGGAGLEPVREEPSCEQGATGPSSFALLLLALSLISTRRRSA